MKVMMLMSAKDFRKASARAYHAAVRWGFDPRRTIAGVRGSGTVLKTVFRA